jgi:energy-converting hydrogenase Eha subunit F
MRFNNVISAIQQYKTRTHAPANTMDARVVVVLIALIVLLWLIGFQNILNKLFPKPIPKPEVPSYVIRGSGVAPLQTNVVYVRYLRLVKVRGGSLKFVRLEAHQSNHANIHLSNRVCV